MSNWTKCKSKCPPKLYINTEVEIQLSLQDNIDFSWNDILNIQIIFTLKDNPATTVTFSKLGGHIISTMEDTVLVIPSVGGISVPGTYILKCIITHDLTSLGITPCPEELTFY